MIMLYRIRKDKKLLDEKITPAFALRLNRFKYMHEGD